MWVVDTPSLGYMSMSRNALQNLVMHKWMNTENILLKMAAHLILTRNEERVKYLISEC